MIYLLQILYAVLCIIEAKLEKYVIAGKRMDISASVDKAEHRWSAVYMVVCGAFIIIPPVILTGNYMQLIILITVPVIRRLFFDFPLKVFRGLSDYPLHIIAGNGAVDRFSRWIFGAHGGYKEIAACISILSVFNYVISKLL